MPPFNTKMPLFTKRCLRTQKKKSSSSIEHQPIFYGSQGIAEACATHCPDAVLLLIVNPVNSIVPAVGELYKKWGLDPKKVVGVTTLDCVRASKFVSEVAGGDAASIEVQR